MYRLIAPAYQYIEACEPFVEGTVPAVDIALITDLDLGDRPGPGVTGAIKVLQRLRQQIVVVPQGADIDHYGVVVGAEGLSIGETLAAGLLRRVATGKAVVLAVASVPEDPIGDALLEGLGVRRIGHAPFTTVFLGTTGGDLVDPPIGLDIRVHGQGVLLEPLSGTEVIVDLVYPYFERTFEHFSGHSYTPPGRRSGYGAIFQRREVNSWLCRYSRAQRRKATLSTSASWRDASTVSYPRLFCGLLVRSTLRPPLCSALARRSCIFSASCPADWVAVSTWYLTPFPSWTWTSRYGWPRRLFGCRCSRATRAWYGGTRRAM